MSGVLGHTTSVPMVNIGTEDRPWYVPAPEQATTFKFTVGQPVQVFERGAWFDAVITKHAAYHGPGYYFQFDPLPQKDPLTHVMPSSGGWKSERSVRARQ